jgi:hypothetical protein
MHVRRVIGPYLRATSSLTYAFWASLPLLVLYEVLIRITNPDPHATVRLSADLWLQAIPRFFGVGTLLFTTLVAVALGVYAIVSDRRNPVALRGRFFTGMVLESLAWSVGLALLVSKATMLLFAMAAEGVGSLSIGQQLALSLGAGLYEELVFRVMLVPVLVYMARLAGMGSRASAVAGVVVGALLFSAVHYMGSLGDPFTLASFTYRFLFGLALNALLLIRGFGITAWTHSLYDVWVILLR